jgi:uncharacterized protein (DUF608 family)
MAIPYSQEELFGRGAQPIYRGRNLDEIAFPLGGLGTGTVSLGGWGQLRDWEIMNRPAKGNSISNSFLTLKVKPENGEPVTRVLQGPTGGSFTADGNRGPQGGGAGLPYFRDVAFQGSFPFARVTLKDAGASGAGSPAAGMPVEVTLEAFNPFIPLNDKDSSIPCAILLYRIKNLSNDTLDATLLGNLTNVIGDREAGGRVNEARKDGDLNGLYLSTSGYEPDSPRYGSMVLGLVGEKGLVWSRWTDGRLSKFWEAVAWSEELPPFGDGTADTGSVGVSFRLGKGGETTVPALICWHFPNFEHYWKNVLQDNGQGAIWRNYYASVWEDAWDVAKYVAQNLERLERETRLFHDALFDSTLPDHVLDAVSSQISILKTTTCLRLSDGTFYGFEGCNAARGCCEGSCTHVWNYAQALPYLFPSLQRSMREADWANSLLPDGFVQFRMPLPLGTMAKGQFHPAADGQMGTVIQLYREWQIGGDRNWLEKMWPYCKRALEFAWKYWDRDRDGVMEGMQHNTYDIEFYGPNTMMGSLYLGALRAGEEMARELGDEEAAAEYQKLYESGSAWTDENLFNGEYYEQKVEPEAHKDWPELYRKRAERHGRDDKFGWPKWQYGKGCISDQLLGQWYGAMLGLGYFYKKQNVKKALQSVFDYNWKADLSDHPGLLRLYALNDEAGLLIGTWPKGERPGYGFYFADEVWCGIEYQAASHMIYEGLVEEGLAVVLGARRRYRGNRRNPWNEIECGHHYARSMSSYSLLLALSGFSYSAPEQRIGFAPRIFGEDFQCFFSVESGWGVWGQRLSKKGEGELSLEIRRGSLTLKTLVPDIRGLGKARATVSGKKVPCEVKEGRISFAAPVTIAEGERLTVQVG